MIYLATPYTHPDPSIQEIRYEKACELTSIIATCSVPCYSPIAFWHPIAQRYNLPGGFEFWRDQDAAAMRGCSELWAVKLEGWARSRGVAHEMSQWQDAKNFYLFDEHELTEVCAQYHERRNASVIALMKTVNALVGTGSPIGVAVGPATNTTDKPDAQDVFGPNL